MDLLITKLEQLVGVGAVIYKPDELVVYECDGLPQHKVRPRAVVFPSTTEQVSAVMEAMHEAGVPLVARGAGTGLSGGALALENGIVIELARMRGVKELDLVNRRVTVETGFVNLHVTRLAAPHGLYYAPDPSSQATCTIGGNLAENAGGIHCLKYGMTVDHVIAATVVLPDGDVVTLKSGTGGYDLLGAFVGSEGTFGIATEATLRLTPVAPSIRTLLADFENVDDGSRAVSALIAEGLMPAALEMMDGETIRAVEASVFAAGMPLDAQAALLIELDGVEAGLSDDVALAEDICRRNGARTVRIADDEYSRKKLWAARKGAFGAMGRISPDLMLQDAVVPRSKLPGVLADVYRIAKKYNLIVANVFHAGDGNLHPFICFDSRKPGEVERVKEAGREIMETCVSAGGTITGEHGVGMDKSEYLPLVFSDADMDAMLRLRAAFDPSGMCNPGKIIPDSKGCGEGRRFNTLAIEREVESVAQGLLKPSVKAVVVAAGVVARTSADAVMPKLEGITPNVEHDDDSIVVSPSSVEEAREIVRLAADMGWPIVPAGARTLSSTEHARDSILLSTREMCAMVEHVPADLTATAEAGLSLASLNASLANANQWLPLDPPAVNTATLGGVAATGLGGAHSYAYGLPRNLIIGMKVLLADGQLIRAGGKVVKNVAGYDLCKLFTGSYGTLGLILELTFKLRPLPRASSTIIVSAESGELTNFAADLMSAPLSPVAVEILSPALVRKLGVGDGPAPVIAVRYAGNQEAVSFQLKETLAMSRKFSSEQSLVDGFEEAQLWNCLSEQVAGELSGFEWRAAFKPLDLLGFIKAGFGSTRLVESEWHAGVYDGRLCAKENGDRPHSEFSMMNEGIKASGGHIVPTGTFDIVSQTGIAGLTRRVKEQFDPAGLFSPGRFVR